MLPFFAHDPFKSYYTALTDSDLRNYMRHLFIALAHLHDNGVMHRDVKPNNFLYNRKEGKYLLVDFGLAQDDASRQKRGRTPKAASISALGQTRPPVAGGTPRLALPGFGTARRLSSHAGTPPVRMVNVSRAGTRGFRAPEVLLRSVQQTVAIDVWSAGIILLSILSGRYPFFQAPEDMSALVEMSCVFGSKPLIALADSLDRCLELPDEHAPMELASLCRQLRGTGPPGDGRPVISDSAYDLLVACLTLNPSSRMSAKDALQHEYLRQP